MNGHSNGHSNGHANGAGAPDVVQFSGDNTGSLLRSFQTDRDFKASQTVYTTSNGVPIAHPYEAQRAGSNGPLLLRDFHLIDLLSHFARERIPERVVHAKGGGAHGYFEVTHPLDDLCLADFVSEKGKKTPVSVRFSTVGGESGSADQARDPRGFSVKFKTSEGNWDFVGNNTPVFFLRDPAKFPHFIHTQKRDPSTHLGGGDNSTHFWDYLSENPEAIHQVVYLFGDRGIPKNYRNINGYSGHNLKLINKNGEWVYAQWHIISDQGRETMTVEEAAQSSPDHSNKDLFEAIQKGDFPSWSVGVQIVKPEEAIKLWEEQKINVLDLTHILPHDQFPIRPVGKMVLNENPKNYFAEIELAAYNPAHLVPGLEPSADPVLQSRLFSYPDAHRYRIGSNYQQLPVNQPIVPYNMGSFQRDGQMAFYNQGSRPAFLSSIDTVKLGERKVDFDAVHGEFTSKAITFLTEIRPEDFNAPKKLWSKVFTDDARQRFITNVSNHMSTSRDKKSLLKMLSIFYQVSPEISEGINKNLNLGSYEKDLSKLSFLGSHNGFAKGEKAAAAGITSNGGPLANGAPIASAEGH